MQPTRLQPDLLKARHAARELPAALRRANVPPHRHLLVVSVSRQRMWLCARHPAAQQRLVLPGYPLLRPYLVSTSAWGIGQKIDSQQTPLGLHAVACKVGQGHPFGTVFRSRKPVGLTWRGRPDAAIVHRILWLEGLEPGFNRGGDVDTFARYIYIHGVGDETTLGRPCSHGCIHVAGADLLPLCERLDVGALVWIAPG